MANSHPVDNISKYGAGPGRKPGSPNKATAELREYVKQIVAGQLPYVDESLDKVREKHPDKYIQLLTRLIDLVLPKQQQVEITSEEGISFKDSLKQTVENASQVKKE